MFKRLVMDGKTTNLYYHRTEGGAEYLTDTYIQCGEHKEGTFVGARVIIRIDGEELEIVKIKNFRGIDEEERGSK